MSGADFFKTPLGKRFYEHTMPELVTQLARIAEALEAIIVALAKRDLQRENPK